MSNERDVVAVVAETLAKHGGRATVDEEFWAAIANWLASVADDPNADYDLIDSEGWCARAVARAYLKSGGSND